MAPLAPFFAEWLYKNLNEATGRENTQSVHLALFPEANQQLIDKALEQRMDYAQRISSLVLSLRKREKIRVRQPLQKVLLPVLDKDFMAQVEGIKHLVLAETNVKELEYVTDTSGLLTKKAKANFKTLGKALGPHMKAVAQAAEALSSEDITAIEKQGAWNVEADGQSFALTPEDLIVTTEDVPGWLVANDGTLTVALDVHLNEQLLAEGTARELVNRIQNLRKAADLQVTDRIKVVLEDVAEVRPAVEQFRDYICTEVLARELEFSAALTSEPVELFEEVQVRISVERMN
jgi:isoleucyl-tRNA synthetase